MAATEVGSLVIKVAADVAQISSDLEKIKGRVYNFSRTTKSQLDPISKAFTNLGTKILGVAAAYMSLGAASRAITSFRNLADTESKLDSFATRLGIATESLREFHYVAERSEVGEATFDSAIQKMVRQISEAADGLGRAKKEIAQLGLSAKALEQAGPERAFYAVIEALKAIPNEADRVRISMHLFDANMLNMIEGGTKRIDELRGAFKEISGPTSINFSQKMKDADTATDNLKTSLSALWRSLADTMAPAYIKAAEAATAMAEAMRKANEESQKVPTNYKDWMKYLQMGMYFTPPAAQFYPGEPSGPRGWAERQRKMARDYYYTENAFVGPLPNLAPDPRKGLYTETPQQAMRRQVAAFQATGGGLRYAGGKELAGLEPKTGAYDLSDFKDYYEGVDKEMEQNAQKMADYWEHHLNTMENITVNVAGGIADSFGGMFNNVIDGTQNMKEAFANLAQSIIANIAQIIAKMIAMYAIEQAIMAAAGIFGFSPTKILKGLGMKHIGGLITQADMPRYHMGGMIRPLGQDEVPIIAQAGERIIPRGASGGTQTPKVEINLHNEGEALNPNKKQMRMDEGKLVVDLWLERMNTSPSERRRARRSLS